jgi:hypothetical protein
MNLREAGVRKPRPLLVCPPSRRDVARLRVGRKEEDIRVAARGKHYGVGHVGLDLPRDHVTRHNPTRPPIDDNDIEHFRTGVHGDRAKRDLTFQRLIGAEKELLARLPTRIESSRYLSATEGPVVEEPAVLARKGHPLGHGLIDDVDREFGQSVNVRLARPVVPPLHRVVKQAVNGVPIALIVLGRVDAALGRDGVRSAGRVVVGEALNLVSQVHRALPRRLRPRAPCPRR